MLHILHFLKLKDHHILRVKSKSELPFLIFIKCLTEIITAIQCYYVVRKILYTVGCVASSIKLWISWRRQKNGWSCQRRPLVEGSGFVWGWFVDFSIDHIRLLVIKCCGFSYSFHVSNAWCASWKLWPHVILENATMALTRVTFNSNWYRFQWINIF